MKLSHRFKLNAGDIRTTDSGSIWQCFACDHQGSSQKVDMTGQRAVFPCYDLSCTMLISCRQTTLMAVFPHRPRQWITLYASIVIWKLTFTQYRPGHFLFSMPEHMCVRDHSLCGTAAARCEEKRCCCCFATVWSSCRAGNIPKVNLFDINIIYC